MADGFLSKNWPWLGAVLLIIVFVASLVDYRPGGDPRPTGDLEDIRALAERDDLNLVFVLIDTLRADRLGSWGYERDTSPLIDQLAATGIRFDRHLAQSSWTKCSMASLWTGLYPQRTGVTRYDDGIAEEATLPAEILKAAGFQTAGIYRNGWVAPNFGFSQGFDVYHSPRPRPLLPSEKRNNPTLSVEGTDVGAMESAASFLRAQGDERFFLYVHLMDIHEYVYDETTADFGDSYSDIYDQSILRLNRVLTSLVYDIWSDPELAARTVLVIASDHGEAFGERGIEGHARNIYPEVTEVPFVIALPFRLEPGLTIDTRSANVDVWPTLLDLFGLPALDPVDGRSFVPDILAAAAGEVVNDAEQLAFTHLDRTWGRKGEEPQPQVAVTRGDHRMVLTLTENGRHEELFDRSEDRFETHDMIDDELEVSAELRKELEAYLDSPPAWADGATTIELDDMKLNQLRALGYSLP